MTTTDIGSLNAEILRNLGIIAEDEDLLHRLARYVRRLAQQKTDEEMSKDEFEHKLAQAEQDISDGKGIKMLPGETLDNFIERVG